MYNLLEQKWQLFARGRKAFVSFKNLKTKINISCLMNWSYSVWYVHSGSWSSRPGQGAPWLSRPYSVPTTEMQALLAPGPTPPWAPRGYSEKRRHRSTEGEADIQSEGIEGPTPVCTRAWAQVFLGNCSISLETMSLSLFSRRQKQVTWKL